MYDTPSGKIQSLNRYAFVLNNPTTFTDRLGLDGQMNCSYDSNGVLVCEPVSPEPTNPVHPRLDPFFLEEFLNALAGEPNPGGSGLGAPGGASTRGAPAQKANTEPAKPSSSPCAGIAGKGGVIPVTSPNGELRFEFNAQGNLTGLGVPLTGGNPATVFGFAVPPQTFFGARLEGPNSLSMGFNYAVQTPSAYGVVSAYLQSVTFSGGSFSNVNGAAALFSVPLGSTTGSSSLLRYFLNEKSEAKNAASDFLSVFQSLNQEVSCTAVFGGN